MKQEANLPDSALPEPAFAQAGQPLWLRVAAWCLSERRPVTREAIALAFSLSERQAGDMMLYIARRRSDLVESRRKVAVLGGGIRVATIEVLALRPGNLPARGARSHRRSAERALPAEVRALMMRGRPAGGEA